MATAKGASKFGPAAKKVADVPGVEPLGTVRRSQLISTYGIGAIFHVST